MVLSHVLKLYEKEVFLNGQFKPSLNLSQGVVHRDVVT